MVVILEGEPPTFARLVNWEDGTARMVKVIPKSMWSDYFKRRIGIPSVLEDGDIPYTENS